jgi:hypothetical protein
MIEGTPLSQLAQQLIAERQMQRDFVADTRRLTPHPVGSSVSIELQHADGNNRRRAYPVRTRPDCEPLQDPHGLRRSHSAWSVCRMWDFSTSPRRNGALWPTLERGHWYDGLARRRRQPRHFRRNLPR